MLRNRIKAIFLTMALAIFGLAAQSFAVPPKQVLRVTQNHTFTGKCCSLWGETVTVNEPATPVPVVVTWSGDFQVPGVNRGGHVYIVIGISVNNGPCLFTGAGSLDEGLSFGNEFNSRTLQWIVRPSDGLVKGKNTFTLCGGGIFAETDSIVLGFNTLTARTSN